MKITKKALLILNATVLAGIVLLLGFSIVRKSTGLGGDDDKSLKLEVYQFNKGWSYYILLKNKIIIKQEYIPAIQRSIPFRNEADARKVGNLVIQKLENHIRPSVSIDELDSLRLNF
jgi:hypothetical protein